jgi:hypothetical protein
MDLDSFLLTLYVLLDDWWQRTRRGVSRCLRDGSNYFKASSCARAVLCCMGGSIQIGTDAFHYFNVCRR